MERELQKIFNHKRLEGDYPVHTFHAYPCKFPAFIPQEIIRKYAKEGYIVFDPFVGSGTTLLEATLLGYSSIGSDINPLSCLLSKVKARPFNEKNLKKVDAFLLNLLWKYEKLNNISRYYYLGIDHWFQDNVIRELTFLKNNIVRIKDIDLKDFLSIILSSIIVRVSNQESDTRYAAINKHIKDYETIKIFIDKAKEVNKIFSDFISKTQNSKIKVDVFQLDARNLSSIKDCSVDMIITSPPYANTYDYYLYHKHRKYWLEMDVKTAQLNEIGSRREFSSLKEDPKKWEEDIKKCLCEMKRVIRRDKNIFIIIGDSVINKVIIKMDLMIRKLSREIGLTYIDSVSAPLARHSKMFNRNFGSSFAKEEHLIMLRK